MKPNKDYRQLKALIVKKISEVDGIPVIDYREAAQKDKSQNFNLFAGHKFDGEKQETIFKTGE